MRDAGRARVAPAAHAQQQTAGPAPERRGADLPLQTKLYPPARRREWAQRRQLIRRLADATARLVLVAAPAGFGKSILIAQWAASAPESQPFAWVSLDRDDNDAVRLWRHVVFALQRACPGFGAEACLQVLRSSAPDLRRTLLPVLINELAGTRVSVVLVLDDYGVIRDPGCREQIEFLLRNLPESVRMVLVTRVDPALPLARLRASGDLTEIRMADLRFSRDETAALVHAVADVRLSEADLADLDERTEGWPAAVHLAALSLRSAPSPGAFIRHLTGSNRYIADFLAEEVVGRQPDAVRRFLERTAILERLTAPLCDTVTESGDAAEIIESLQRDNLFVIPLDDERRWFRYHHLFAQMLRGRLVDSEPDLVPALHRRASAWHREHGSPEEAIRHSLAAGDLSATVDLIARHWGSYVGAGQIATVRAWLRSLGDERIGADPVAAHCAAWVAALSGERFSVRRLLPVIEAGDRGGPAGDRGGPLPDGMKSLASSAALLRAVFGFDSLRVMRGCGTEAVKLEDDPATTWYAAARAALGWSLYLTGEPEAAAPVLREALMAEHAVPMVRMLAQSVLCLVALAEGRPVQAEACGRAAGESIAAGSFGEVPQVGIADLAAGAVHAQQGRLQDARREFERALHPRLGSLGLSPWPTLEIQLRLAAVLLDLGEHRAAAALLGEAAEVLHELPDGTEALRDRLQRLARRLPASLSARLPTEPLTEGEHKVLRLLQGTLSLREIGQQLFVSVNTVKTHTRVVYRKLGVATRQDAVRRARELGIL